MKMRISSPALPAPRNGLSHLAMRVIVTTLALAIVPVTAVSQQENPRRRWEYFYQQRAYPFDRIPAGALQAARQQEVARWPAQFAPGASFAATWTAIGPAQITQATNLNSSGRLTAIAVHPTNSSIIYIGGAQGGVWKTTNGGTSWSALTDTQCSLAMGGLAIDPVDPNIIYAGTGEQHFSGDSYYGCGVLRSADGGTTWTQLGGSIFATSTGGAKISRVVIDPRTAGSTATTTVLAASDFGLFRSTNSGATWTQVLATVATDIVVDASTDPTTMYAGGSLATVRGVHKSTDGGATWTKLTSVLPTETLWRVNLAIAPSAPNTVYAALVGQSTLQTLLGLYKTTDGGTTWTKLTATNASCSFQCWYDLTIAVKPDDPNTIFFGGVDLFKSIDGGATFAAVSSFPAGPVHADQHFLAFDPQTPSTVFVGNDGGLYKSTDTGANWTTVNTNLALTQFYPGISLHPTDANVVMGGTQDNGTPLARVGGGTVWDDVIGGDGGSTAIDFLNPIVRYGETQWTPSSGFSGPRRSDGGSYSLKLNGITTSDRALFIPPMIMDPTFPEILYFGTFRLYRTTDRGESWTALTGDLTSGGSGISTMAVAPSNSSVVYVGTSDGRVHVSTDNGATFVLRITGLPNRHIKDFSVDPADPLTALVTVSGFLTGHVFKTVNGGVSWQDISSNLPDVPVNAVLYDPATTSTIYVGTDLGVYRSTDGGTNWSPFNDGLPLIAVFDLAAEPNTGLLVAATHGRSMFKATITAPVSMRVAPGTAGPTVDFGGAAVSDSAVLKIEGTGASSTAWTAATGGATWLNLTTVSGTGSTRLRWTADPTGLAPATYMETITVTAAGASGSPATIDVTFTVNATLVLAVTPASRADTVVAGSTTAVIDSADVTITGPGSGTQAWNATHTAAAWLTLTTAGGTGSGKVRWSRDPTGLAAGTYVDTIVVTSTNAGGSPASIIDTLLVQAALALAVTPNSRSSGVVFGSTSAVTDSADVTLTGFGAANQAWTATHTTAAWVTLTTAAGTGTGKVRWSRDPTGLALGTHVDTITVTSAGVAGSPATIVDTLIVDQALVLTLDPTTLSDTTTGGSTIVTSDSVTVTLTGLGSSTAAWTASKSGSTAWVTLTTASGTGSGMVRWTRDPTGLPLGKFVATLTVTAVGATGSPADITDTLVVAQALMLSVSPQAKADTTMEGATIVSSDSTAVTIIGLGSSAAVWSATHTSAPWLTLTTSGGTSSGMARWTRDPSGLSAGTLVDTIAVTTTGASPDTVTVTLVVVPPVSVTSAVNHILIGSVLSALQEAFLDSNGNGDGTYNVGDVLAWLDRCNSATPEGCVASEAEIEEARAVLDGLQQGTAGDSQLMREGRLK